MHPKPVLIFFFKITDLSLKYTKYQSFPLLEQILQKLFTVHIFPTVCYHENILSKTKMHF